VFCRIFGPDDWADLPLESCNDSIIGRTEPSVWEDGPVSKKPRARSASQDAPATAPSPARPEPAVFRDMRIEEGRISDGRRIIYFSWPGGAPEVPAPGEVVPEAAPEAEPMVGLAGEAPAPAPMPALAELPVPPEAPAPAPAELPAPPEAPAPAELPAPPEAPAPAELPAPPELPSADEDWIAADRPPEDEDAADV